MHCTECDTEHQRVLLSNIPEEKIQEQRKRYLEQQRQNIRDVYSEFLGGRSNPLFDLFAPVENKTRIVEGDAGQKFIDDERKQKESEERMKRYEEHQKLLQWKAQYKGLGRNDTCICGSGKKYKKCCLTKCEKIN